MSVMKTTLLDVDFDDGSATYVSRPPMLSSRPVGVPERTEPERQHEDMPVLVAMFIGMQSEVVERREFARRKVFEYRPGARAVESDEITRISGSQASFLPAQMPRTETHRSSQAQMRKTQPSTLDAEPPTPHLGSHPIPCLDLPFPKNTKWRLPTLCIGIRPPFPVHWRLTFVQHDHHLAHFCA